MRLGTHNGPFHADEVIATVILRKLYPEAEVIRSRDPRVLAACDIVYDVGRGRYDHHSLEKEYRDNGIPYAASGLVWRDFGRELLKREGLSGQELDAFFQEIDEWLIQPIDALDNGYGIEKSLPILDITTMIKQINPSWDAEESEEVRFAEAISFAQGVFDRFLEKLLAAQRAWPVVQAAFQNRPCPEIMVLETGCPWDRALMQLDEKQEVLFVICPRNNGQFTVQGVPVEEDYTLRLPFPDPWAGLEGKELADVTGVADAIFCHSGLWLAVAGSLKGAVRLAELAIASAETVPQ